VTPRRENLFQDGAPRKILALSTTTSLIGQGPDLADKNADVPDQGPDLADRNGDVPVQGPDLADRNGDVVNPSSLQHVFANNSIKVWECYTIGEIEQYHVK